MRARLLPALALVLTATLAGCGGDETADSVAAPPASDLPSADAPALPTEEPTTAAPAAGGAGIPVVAASPLPEAQPSKPEPGSGATALEQIGYALEKDAVRTAQAPAKTSTTCSGTFDKTGDVPCVVDYAGLKIPYTVTVTSAQSIVSGYRFTTTKGVLTKKVVLATVGSNGGFPSFVDPRCVIPEEQQLVTLDQPSGVTCTWGLKVDPDVRTIDVVLTNVDIQLKER